MKFFILIILLFPLNVVSQQTLELCDTSLTFLYSTIPTGNGVTQWEVNNQYYYGDEVSITWSSIGEYTLIASRVNDDCSSEPVTYNVNVIACENIQCFVPNSFTPDGNSLNNGWIPIFFPEYLVKEYQLIIYNRWGEIIWESFDFKIQWDGTYNNKNCQDGVYIWMITYNTIKDPYNKIIYGHVNLIR